MSVIRKQTKLSNGTIFNDLAVTAAVFWRYSPTAGGPASYHSSDILVDSM